MKKTFLGLVLFTAALAQAGSPLAIMPMPMPTNPGAPPPVLPNTPSSCSTGLPMGAPAVRTETRINFTTKQVSFESYLFVSSQIVHRIQSSRIDEDLSFGAVSGAVTGYACQRHSYILTKVKERKMPMTGNCNWSAWTERTLTDDATTVHTVYVNRGPGAWELVDGSYDYRHSNAMSPIDYKHFQKRVQVIDGNYWGQLRIERHNRDEEVAQTPCTWYQTVAGVLTEFVSAQNCGPATSVPPYPLTNRSRVKARIGPLEDDVLCRNRLSNF